MQKSLNGYTNFICFLNILICQQDSSFFPNLELNKVFFVPPSLKVFRQNKSNGAGPCQLEIGLNQMIVRELIDYIFNSIYRRG